MDHGGFVIFDFTPAVWANAQVPAAREVAICCWILCGTRIRTSTRATRRCAAHWPALCREQSTGGDPERVFCRQMQRTNDPRRARGFDDIRPDGMSCTWHCPRCGGGRS